MGFWRKFFFITYLDGERSCRVRTQWFELGWIRICDRICNNFLCSCWIYTLFSPCSQFEFGNSFFNILAWNLHTFSYGFRRWIIINNHWLELDSQIPFLLVFYDLQKPVQNHTQSIRPLQCCHLLQRCLSSLFPTVLQHLCICRKFYQWDLHPNQHLFQLLPKRLVEF